MIRRDRRRERGAAAVEMAIVLPLLLLLVGAMIDLGRVYLGEVIVTNAARDAARMASYQSYSVTQVQARGVAAAAGIKPFVTTSDPVVTMPYTVTSSPPTCTVATGETVASTSVTVTATGFSWMVLNVIPHFFGGNIAVPTIAATASMQCPPAS